MKEEQTVFAFNEGVMWQDNPFQIRINDECSDNSGQPCRHCHSHHEKTHKNAFGGAYTEKTWVCPAVISVTNEGGYSSTGLCLDCLLDAVASKNIRNIKTE